MNAGFAQVYAVELLCGVPPRLAPAELLVALRDRVGAAGLVDPEAKTAGLNFHFPQHRVPFKGDSVPVQAVVGMIPHRVDDRFSAAALEQTWDWDGAVGAVDRHRCSVVVSDLLAAPLPYQDRLELFQNVLLAALDVIPAIAILWRPCGRLVDPTAYRRSHEVGDDRDPLYGPVNVRMFPSDEEGRETLMDTLGLSALGLPDLQCRFERHDPNAVAALLQSAARYVFEKGPVLEEGHTVPGPGGRGTWLCRPGQASAPPARAVVEIVPGE